MEWIDPEEGYGCLCFCPLNHGADIECNDTRITNRGEHSICDACALAMGQSLDTIKREIASIL